MIHAHVGLPGTGKTTWQSLAIYNRVLYSKKKYEVYANYHLVIPDFTIIGHKPFRSRANYLDSESMATFIHDLALKKPDENRRIILAIDEASGIFDSNQWQSLPHDVKVRFQNSRKLKTSIYYTTQNIKRVNIILRELTHYVTKCKVFNNPFIRDEEDAKPLWFVAKTYTNEIIDSQSEETYKNAYVGTKMLFFWQMKKPFSLFDTDEFVDYKLLNKI